MKTPLVLIFVAGMAVALVAQEGKAADSDQSKAAMKSAVKISAVKPRFSSPAKISAVRGEQVFVDYCAICHGMQGRGDGPRSAFFSEIQYIPDFTIEGFVEGRDPEVLEGIREGLRRLDEPSLVMPQFKYILSENDIRSALAYVKTLPDKAMKK